VTVRILLFYFLYLLYYLVTESINNYDDEPVVTNFRYETTNNNHVIEPEE